MIGVLGKRGTLEPDMNANPASTSGRSPTAVRACYITETTRLQAAAWKSEPADHDEGGA